MSTILDKTQEILGKLVAFPVLGGQSNLGIAEWIEGYLENHDISFYVVPNENKTKRSIHCRIGPPVDDGVILSGHMDVVPVTGQNWDSDPFVLTEKGDGILYGRGSCDMKGFISCCLAMVPVMRAANLKKPIYLAFSYDEEIGCLAAPDLAADIKSTYTESIKYAIIGEPSMMQPIIGQKGMVIYKTTINGSEGHSSRIKQEVSAIHEAARLIGWLENKMNTLVDEGHIDDRFSPPHTSIHVGMMDQSGIAPNIISSHAQIYWDLRCIPRDHAKDIRKDFDDYCQELVLNNRKRFADFNITTIAKHPIVPPLDTANESDIVSLIKKISGRSDLGAVSYAAEAGQFAEARYQSVICGPGSIEQAHRANEFISREQLEKGLHMIENLIKYSSS